MTAGLKIDAVEAEARESAGTARLRPADRACRDVAGQPAGPFEISAPRKAAGMREALLTGLLVIYPAFATVAAVVAGFFLAGAGGA
jgi:hypothetical protein